MSAKCGKDPLNCPLLGAGTKKGTMVEDFRIIVKIGFGLAAEGYPAVRN